MVVHSSTFVRVGHRFPQDGGEVPVRHDGCGEGRFEGVGSALLCSCSVLGLGGQGVWDLRLRLRAGTISAVYGIEKENDDSLDQNADCEETRKKGWGRRLRSMATGWSLGGRARQRLHKTEAAFLVNWSGAPECIVETKGRAEKGRVDS